MTLRRQVVGPVRRPPGPLKLLMNDKAGVAAVEVALISAIVFLPFLGGLTGFGLDIMLQLKLDRALHAAILTSYAPPTALTSANVQTMMATAVQSGYGSSAPTTTASLSYYCISPTGTRTGTGVATAPTCTSPNIVATYLVISTSVTFVPLVNTGIAGWNQAGGTAGTVTVTSNATVRTQ